MPALILLKSPAGASVNATIPLGADPMILGRDENGCQIVLPHTAISRKHAVITQISGQYFIEDLKSRNKTFVNSKELPASVRQPLRPDDRIKICDFLFRFQDDRLARPKELPEWMHREEAPESEEDTGQWEIIATAGNTGWTGGNGPPPEPPPGPEPEEPTPGTPVVVVAGAQPVADFLAPEQIHERAGAPSEATDLHAVGVMMFQMLTGELPFPPGRPGGKLETIVKRSFLSCAELCRDKGVASKLAPVIDSCLRGDYRQTRFLLADLTDLLGKPEPPPPIPPPTAPTPDEPFMVAGFLFEDQLTETYTAIGTVSRAVVNLRLLKFAYDTPDVREVYRNATATPADAPAGVLRRYRVGRGNPVPVAVRTRFEVDANAAEGGCLAVVEEYAGQRTLMAAIEEGKCRGNDAAILRIAVPLLESLGYSHSRGAIHARLTPYCVFLTDTGGVKVEGFGGFKPPAPDGPAFGIHATVEAVRLNRGGESTGMTGVGGNRLVIGRRPADPPPDAHSLSGRFKMPGPRTDPAPTATQQAERLEALLDISVSLGRILELDPLLNQVAETLLGVFKQADRCFVIQLDENRRPVSRVSRSRREAAGDPRFSRTLVRKTVETGQAYLSEDASRDDYLGPAMSIAEFRIRSAMCAPLKDAAGNVFGAIQVDTLDRVKRFVQDDLKLLNAVTTLSGVAAEKARLHEAVLAREREQREIELARRVQLGFLPQAVPEVPGYEFFARYSPAQTVGGDYYDFISLPGGRVAVVLGDVAGKGVPAALLVAKLSSEVRFCLLTEPNLAQAVCLLNEQMIRGGLGDRFVVLAVLVLDPATHEVTAVNAGHADSGVKRYRAATGEFASALPLEVMGVPIGALPGYPFEQVKFGLEAGDSVVAFTDGVTDAMNPSGAMFGTEAIDRHLASAPGDPVDHEGMRPRRMGERLVAAVRAHANGRAQNDDIAVVAFGRVELGPQPPTATDASRKRPS